VHIVDSDFHAPVRARLDAFAGGGELDHALGGGRPQDFPASGVAPQRPLGQFPM